jgi:hypothetical protein
MIKNRFAKTYESEQKEVQRGVDNFEGKNLKKKDK